MQSINVDCFQVWLVDFRLPKEKSVAKMTVYVNIVWDPRLIAISKSRFTESEMPIPADDTQEKDGEGSSSHTAAGDSTQEILQRFKRLGEEASAEEAEGDHDDDEDDDDAEEDGEAAGAAGPSTNGDGKKKKKKKKGKAKKAVERLKWVSVGTKR